MRNECHHEADTRTHQKKQVGVLHYVNTEAPMVSKGRAIGFPK